MKEKEPFTAEEAFAKIIRDNETFVRKMNQPSKWFRGREDEIDLLCDSLYKKRMRNCILVGPAGCGKTIIVEKASELLKDNWRFLQLDLGAANSGCTLIGTFERRFIGFLDSVELFNKKYKAEKPIVIFVDEIHSIEYLNKNEQNGTVGAADILKQYLSRGSVTIVGATTNYEWERSISRDPAMARRFPPIYIDELSKDMVLSIMKHFADKAIGFNAEMLELIYEESRKIGISSQPDAAIEILDQMMAHEARTGEVPTVEDAVSRAKRMGAISRSRDQTPNVSQK